MEILRRLKFLDKMYFLAFLASLGLYLLVYINSNFLLQFLDEKVVGLVFSFASFLTIISLVVIPKILRLIGNRILAQIIFATLALSFYVIAFIDDFNLIIAAVIIYLVFHTLTLYTFDIFLERCSCTISTGEIRGKTLTVAAIALLIAPLVVGLLLGDGNEYWLLYFMALVLFVLTFILFSIIVPRFDDREYSSATFREAVHCIIAEKNTFSIFMSNLILRIFYSWTTIYYPLFLHAHLGLPWSDIGIILTLSITPFILLSIPLGKIADSWLGEKELLIAGFIILAVATAGTAFISSSSILVWAGVLFVARIGATMIESMSETYFFKHVDSTDTNTISIFRMTRPLSMIVGPIVASTLLIVMPLQYTFLVVAAIVLYGVHYASQIEDTL